MPRRSCVEGRHVDADTKRGADEETVLVGKLDGAHISIRLDGLRIALAAQGLHVVTAADKAVTEEAAALAEELLGHLDYCGWGDSWERECSESLRERATAWFARRREAAK